MDAKTSEVPATTTKSSSTMTWLIVGAVVFFVIMIIMGIVIFIAYRNFNTIFPYAAGIPIGLLLTGTLIGLSIALAFTIIGGLIVFLFFILVNIAGGTWWAIANSKRFGKGTAAVLGITTSLIPGAGSTLLPVAIIQTWQ